MTNNHKVLLAGATGYLGQFIAQELQQQGIQTTILVRNPIKFKNTGIAAQKVIKASLTTPKTLHGCCKGIQTVISSVGITRQKDGLSYMQVDYQANLNLLQEAQKSGVQKFIYIAALKGDELQHLKIFEAKEKFVAALQNSGLDYTIIRPNGFFSDLSAFYEMAKKGRIYLFGKGQAQLNPIHGSDLAKACVAAIDQPQQELAIGGPELLSQVQIAQLAFKSQGKTPKITYIPDWIRKVSLQLGRYLIPSKTFGPIEFFMTVLALDMVAPKYGTHTVGTYFEALDQADASPLS
ncbi:MAG: SDR family oxidoreductase [Aureispira sp.]